MSEKPPFVTEPRCYQVSFDATIPNVHPAALPGERQRVALTRVVTAWDALDASNQVKMECERAYREDKTAPHWKATKGVLPYWEAKFCGSAGTPVFLTINVSKESIHDPKTASDTQVIRAVLFDNDAGLTTTVESGPVETDFIEPMIDMVRCALNVRFREKLTP